MEIKGYVNPRSLGNTEPNELFGMDVFFEDSLWQKYLDKGTATTVRVWDTCFMLRNMCSPYAIRDGGSTFLVHYPITAKKPTKLKAYFHHHWGALCVGLDS